MVVNSRDVTAHRALERELNRRAFLDALPGLANRSLFVAEDSEGAAMVRSVIELTRTLGLTSIAEGVEGAEQLIVLEELGCDNAQGYLFARPVSGTTHRACWRHSVGASQRNVRVW